MQRLVTVGLSVLFTLAIALGSASTARADSSAAAAAVQVSVTLTEMAVSLDRATIPAGPVVFNIVNKGSVEHEFVVLKTDIPEGNLPPSVSEAGKAAEIGHVTEIDPVPAGASLTLAATLSPGNYVLICNKPGHYLAGMHAALTVTQPIGVTLKEMSVTPSQSFMRAGTVTFNISNTGAALHELVVIKTSLPEGALPPDPANPGQVDETGSQGEADNIAPGATATLTLTLTPGRYTLICDQPGHYAAGMHTSFTVLPTLSRVQSAGIDADLAAEGYEDLSDIGALTNVQTLLAAPGIRATDLDRAAIAAGIIPRAVAADGSLIY